MTLALIGLALATFIATYLGGLFALKFKDKSHLIVGFSAGAVIGLAFFDLLPEAIEISGIENITTTTTLIALGFLVYMLLDRTLGVHVHHDHDSDHSHGEHISRGTLRAGSFSFHSFLDGIGIGLGFQLSPMLGTVIAVAVLAHDFSDGINTVSAIIKNGGERARALRWLFIDAFAPVAGIITTLFFSASEKSVGIILALFSGFFLYIGASDLVPESYHAHPTMKTTLATIFGAGFLFLIITLAG